MRAGFNIVSNNEHVDRATRHFFMRTALEGPEETEALAKAVRASLPHGARVHCLAPRPPRLVILVTKEAHCLGDLLIRSFEGILGATIEAVVSNRDVLRPLVEKFELPFHLVPHQGRTREAHEAAVADVIQPYTPDLLVLAKYMRILSPGFVARYPQRMLNIHHSFLPAFVGARPYKQAFDRGVKIVGATAHFVTDDLDEGPIVSQDTVAVGDDWGPEEMARGGRDVEKVVLARALRQVIEGRVFIAGNRTVVL